MTNKLISICIPSYNGEKKIANTLDSIISNIEKSKDIRDILEVIITDDCSTDKTSIIVNEYVKKYSYIKIFNNNINLGMDGNFKQVALNASGKYIWYSGQDDVFLDGSIERAVKAIKRNPEIDIVSVNFSQYSEKKNQFVCESMFHSQSFYPEKLDYENDFLFNGADEYFSFFNDVPSFLPSIIMKREFWLKTNNDKYFGTYFIQYATILLNINNARILSINKPLIRGLIPFEGWQTNGEKLFSIQLGIMKARELVFMDSRNPFPLKIFNSKKIFYLRRFLRIVVASKHYSFLPSKQNRDDLKMIYGNFLYYFYFSPILFFVGIIPRRLVSFIFNTKQKINV